MLYQHLFWFWGHPEVYILFLPAVGMVTTIITVFARRPLAGYLWQVAALIAVAFISFGVWVHHMFATGLPTTAMGFFSAASFVIAIPSAVLYFSWIGTMWGGRVRFTTPMLFALGFLLIFLLGGITGVMVAALPFDLQVTDSYFIVAHFHYVLNGAVVFPIFGAVYYWMPKMTGRLLSERLGKWSFWTMLVGFNVTFGPMHVLGELGMARRMYTYDNGLGWDTLNLVISLGSLVFAAGTLLTVGNVLWSVRRGAVAGADPWHADTLEWSIPSPAPEHNFTTIPVVRGRHPLWGPGRRRCRARPGRRARRGRRSGHAVHRRPGHGARGGAGRPRADRRPRAGRARGVRVLRRDAHLGVTVVLVLGVLVGLTGIVTWGWRTEVDHPAVRDARRPHLLRRLVLGPQDRTRRPGWWGMVLLIITEAMIFAALLSSYFFVRANSAEWPQGGIEPPELGRITVFTVILLASSIPLFWGEAAIRRGQVGRLRVALAISWLLGAAFVVNQVFEFRQLEFSARDNAYASLFIVITGLHGLHLVVGLAMSVVVQLKAALGWFDAERHQTVAMFSHVLALRRRRVDLRVHLAVPRSAPVSTRPVARPTTTRPAPSGPLVWAATFGSIVAWIVHLSVEAALVPAREAHPDVVWLMHGITLALALAGPRRDARQLGTGPAVDRRRGTRHARRAHGVPRLGRASCLGAINLLLIVYEGLLIVALAQRESRLMSTRLLAVELGAGRARLRLARARPAGSRRPPGCGGSSPASPRWPSRWCRRCTAGRSAPSPATWCSTCCSSPWPPRCSPPPAPSSP